MVGRHDQRGARAPDRLAGKDWTPEIAKQTGAKARTRTRASPSPPPTTRRSTAEWDNPAGVAIDAFIFGGRRSTTVPLVTEAFDWVEGVPWPPPWARETTAAAAGQGGHCAPRPVRDAAVRRLQHGGILRPLAQKLGERLAASGAKLPKIFTVNWFRGMPMANSSGRASATTCA